MPSKKQRRGTRRTYSVTPPRDTSSCPTPAKRAYSSLPEAKRAKRADTGPKPLSPYECRCGWWHLATRRRSP